MGPRLHPVGTLASLRYETLDETGERIDTWQVRALVPNVGNGKGPSWRPGCNRGCVEEATHNQGTRIWSSGAPGIAEEWVLRMPVGQSFDLGPTPLRTQDILDARERSVGSVRVGDRFVQRQRLQQHKLPVLVHLSLICRYDLTANRWQRLPAPKKACQ